MRTLKRLTKRRFPKLKKETKATIKIFFDAQKEMLKDNFVQLWCIMSMIVVVVNLIGKTDATILFITVGSVLTSIILIPLIIVREKKENVKKL